MNEHTKKTFLVMTMWITVVLLWLFIFILLYTGLEFTLPVSQSVRFNVSFVASVMMVVSAVAIMYRRELWGFIKSVTPEMDDAKE